MATRSYILLLIAVFMTSTLLFLAPSVHSAEQDDIDEYLDVEEEDAAAGTVAEGKVVTLTSENFDATIKNNKNVLVRGFGVYAD